MFAIAQPQIEVQPLNSPRCWQRAEFRITGPPPVVNPFDPSQIRVDAAFKLPDGRSVTVPAFWYQPYHRSLSQGREHLSLAGEQEWRVRYCPTTPGSYSVTATVRTNEILFGKSSDFSFGASATNSTPLRGYARVGPGRQYLETTLETPIQLVGHNVCWHHARGTFDYDEWFTAMAANGENFARLWMWPHAFGLETDKDSLNRYRMDRAWQLDYVLELAEQKGIHILLCLDYHGMFEQKPDYWGGNNYWLSNPYNSINGGPAPNQNGFFTSAAAKSVYQKRLRYLVARYGFSPSLLAWEFFNEIDNVYSYLNSSDVAAWHRVMSQWLRANDPFGHMITTSLTGNSDRQEIWNIPDMDFSGYHSYGEPQPASRLATVAQSFLQRYEKPVMIGEFGTDWRGWNRSNDPFLRGFRQGLWGGALGGSMGSTMSWWWENIHSENLYPLFTAMTNILMPTGWGRGTWTNAAFVTSGPPPSQVDTPLAGGEPFNITLRPGSGWGARPSGRLAVANAVSAGYAAANLNSFVHGSAHADLRTAFRLHSWLTNDARIVLHLNSVSSGAVLSVRVEGIELLRTNLADLDGQFSVNNEYNIDLTLALPSGRKTIDILNAGSDWFYLDWVRLERVLPANYPSNWQPSPEAIGLRSANETLLYVVAPTAAFPASATNGSLPLQVNQTLTLTNFPSGEYVADWFVPTNGARIATFCATAKTNLLTLHLPPFYEDLVGRIIPPARLSAVRPSADGDVLFELQSVARESFNIETSSDLDGWNFFLRATNSGGRLTFDAPAGATNSAAFFRAKRG